jgi:dephospho-CoA kinase
MKVIGVCGEIGAGKDVFADYLVRKKGFQKLVMSDMITEEIKRLGREVNREEMVRTGQEYRQKYGRGVWAKVCVDYARKNRYRRVVISGVRDIEEVEIFRRELSKDFMLVYVTASKELRHKRIIERAGVKDPKTIEDIERQEAKENDVFTLNGHFEKYADKKVLNNGMLVELFAAADLLLKETGFESKEY